jgi:hypothetical protein
MLQLIYALKKHNNWRFPTPSQPWISFHVLITVRDFILQNGIGKQRTNIAGDLVLNDRVFPNGLKKVTY